MEALDGGIDGLTTTIDIIKKHITNLQTTRKSISILISDHIFPHVLDISDNIFSFRVRDEVSGS